VLPPDGCRRLLDHGGAVGGGGLLLRVDPGPALPWCWTGQGSSEPGSRRCFLRGSRRVLLYLLLSGPIMMLDMSIDWSSHESAATGQHGLSDTLLPC
jgi:hypothetical protein